jgi:uncharacterized protein (DUF1778 family)
MGVAATEKTARKKHLNIRTSEEEYRQLKDFARFQGKTLSSFALDAMWAQIEDWEDTKAVKEYERDKAAGTIESIPWAQVQEELRLQ